MLQPSAFDANHDAPVVENSVPCVDAHSSQARVQGTRFHFLTRFERRPPTVFCVHSAFRLDRPYHVCHDLYHLLLPYLLFFSLTFLHAFPLLQLIFSEPRKGGGSGSGKPGGRG